MQNIQSPATTDAVYKAEGGSLDAPSLRRALLASRMKSQEDIYEFGETVSIASCFVDAHKASYLVEQLKNGVIFTNGKVSVLSGFIPDGVSCTHVKRSVDVIMSRSWSPLFSGTCFEAHIEAPISMPYMNGELLFELDNLGNFARAASTIIPCAHLKAHGKVSTMEYRGSHVPKNEDSAVIINEMWFGVN